MTNVIVGSFCNVVMGIVMPALGFVITACMFSMMIEDLEEMRETVNSFIIFFLYIALLFFFGTFFAKVSFMFVGENITMNMRKEMYESVIQKHIGWHDDRENAAGILTSVLAKDTAVLNGASVEGVSVMVESACALLTGLIAGFYFSWQVALVALGVVPLMTIGGVLGA